MKKTTDSKTILVTCNQGVMTIAINRPEKKNALNCSMYMEMIKALNLAKDDDAIKVVLFHGVESSFSAGNDLNDFNDRDPNSPSPAVQLLYVLHEFNKPVVAAVSGLAVGIGVTMLLHCDIVYASPETRFRLPFVNLGVCPEAGSTLILPVIAGHRRAAELLMLGDFFDSLLAVDACIITRIVPLKNLLDISFEKALSLAEKPMEALSVTKKLLKQADSKPVSKRIEEEAALFSRLLLTPESVSARKNK